jgi:hypothetical protein
MAEKKAVSLGESVMYAAAGVADMVYGRVEDAARRVHSQLRRSDITDMARDGHEDLVTRGELAIRRRSATSESHLEVLARWVVQQRGAERTEDA